MKILTFIFFMFLTLGCSSYKPLMQADIKLIYILYKNKDVYRQQRNYVLYDSTIVRWSKTNKQIKETLSKYKSHLSELKKENARYIKNFIEDKKNNKYRPIKVTPLTEFGYLEMVNGKLVYYGIMGDDVFVDLTNDWVYY